ncbi:MAG TPA: 3'-5' exonuclease [Nevskiaceae bacterium]|nr:3'-5' exonuclease [Nevskiaceae bacterium]
MRFDEVAVLLAAFEASGTDVQLIRADDLSVDMDRLLFCPVDCAPRSRHEVGGHESFDLMVVGDGHRRIYGRVSSLGRCGINIRWRGRKLPSNYRTTEQVRRFATAVLENLAVDDLYVALDTLAGYRSLVDGATLALRGFDSVQAEAEWVAAEITRLMTDGARVRDICVVGRTKISLKSVISTLGQRSLKTLTLGRDDLDNARISGVRLANRHRVNGVAFKVVRLFDASAGVVPSRIRWLAQVPVPLKQKRMRVLGFQPRIDNRILG